MDSSKWKEVIVQIKALSIYDICVAIMKLIN